MTYTPKRSNFNSDNRFKLEIQIESVTTKNPVVSAQYVIRFNFPTYKIGSNRRVSYEL